MRGHEQTQGAGRSLLLYSERIRLSLPQKEKWKILLSSKYFSFSFLPLAVAGEIGKFPCRFGAGKISPLAAYRITRDQFQLSAIQVHLSQK